MWRKAFHAVIYWLAFAQSSGETVKSVKSSTLNDNVSAESAPRLYRNVPIGVYASAAPYAAYSFHLPTFITAPKAAASRIIPVKEQIVIDNANGYLRDSYGNKFVQAPQFAAYKNAFPQQFLPLQELPAHLTQPLVAAATHSKHPSPHYFVGSQYRIPTLQVASPQPGTGYGSYSQPLVYTQNIRNLGPTPSAFPQNQAINVQQRPSNNNAVYVNTEPVQHYTNLNKEIKFQRLEQHPEAKPEVSSSVQSNDKAQIQAAPATVTAIVNGKKTVVNIETKPPVPLLDISLLEPLTFDNPLVPQVQHFLPRISEATYHKLPEATVNGPNKHKKEFTIQKTKSYDNEIINGKPVPKNKPNPPSHHADDTQQYKPHPAKPTITVKGTPNQSPEFSYEINSPNYKETYKEQSISYNKASDEEPVSYSYDGKVQSEPINYSFSTNEQKKPVNINVVHTSKEPVQIKHVTYQGNGEAPKHLVYTFKPEEPRGEHVENHNASEESGSAENSSEESDDDSPSPPQSEPQRNHPTQSHPLQSHPIQSHPIQSHNIQSHPIQSHNIQSHPIQSHNIQSHPIQSHPIQSHPIQSHDIQSHLIQSHSVQSHPNPQSHHSSKTYHSNAPKNYNHGPQQEYHHNQHQIENNNHHHRSNEKIHQKPQGSNRANGKVHYKANDHYAPNQEIHHRTNEEVRHKQYYSPPPKQTKLPVKHIQEVQYPVTQEYEEDLRIIPSQSPPAPLQSNEDEGKEFDFNPAPLSSLAQYQKFVEQQMRAQASTEPPHIHSSASPVIHEKAKRIIIQEESPDEMHSHQEQNIMAEMEDHDGNDEEDFEKAYKNAAYGFPAFEAKKEDTDSDFYNPRNYGYAKDYDISKTPFQEYHAEGDSFPKSTRANYKDARDHNKEDYYLEYSVNKPESMADRYQNKANYYKLYKSHRPEKYFALDNNKERKSEKYTVAPAFDFSAAPKTKQNYFAQYTAQPQRYEYNYEKDAPRDSSAHASRPFQRLKSKTHFVEPQFQYGFEPIALPRLLDSELAAMASNDSPESEKPGMRKKVYKENWYIKKTSTSGGKPS